MNTYRIEVIAGDGIGQEVIPAGVAVLKIVAEQRGFRCEFTEFPWGCDFYLQSGRMLDPDGLEQVQAFDAIYLGAIGDPRVADHISARELILPLRLACRQFVSLRPMRLLPGITSPLGGRTAADIDMICVRENSEGEYCGIGGRLHAGTADELAEQTGVIREKVLVAETGDIIRLDPDRAEIVGKAPGGRVLIDEGSLEEVADLVIRDRRHISEDGIVLPVIAINKQTGAIQIPPEIVFRGMAVNEDDELVEECRQLVIDTIEESTVEERGDWAIIKDKVRRALKRYIRKQLSTRPLVLPVIMEI